MNAVRVEQLVGRCEEPVAGGPFELGYVLGGRHDVLYIGIASCVSRHPVWMASDGDLIQEP